MWSLWRQTTKTFANIAMDMSRCKARVFCVSVVWAVRTREGMEGMVGVKLEIRTPGSGCVGGIQRTVLRDLRASPSVYRRPVCS